MVKISYALLPDYPVSEALDIIKTADDLGFHGCYVADEIYHRDLWTLCAAAARETNSIRFAPDVTHVYLREPTLIAQHLATLDEISDGRAEAVISFGNLVMLESYHIPWQGQRPLARLKESLHVIRTLLDSGELDYEGEFFKYTGLFTSARPVQERLPLKIGAMGGPKSFELVGEIADGIHHACGYSRENYDYVVEHVRNGAKRAGRDWRDLDMGAWGIAVVSENGEAARQAARIMAGFYIPAMPKGQVERHGLDYEELRPIFDAIAKGDVQTAFDLTTPELGETLSISGTPDECVEKIRANMVDAGMNHIILCLIDPYLVDAFSGLEVPGVPDVREQMRLVHDHIMPAFA